MTIRDLLDQRGLAVSFDDMALFVLNGLLVKHFYYANVNDDARRSKLSSAVITYALEVDIEPMLDWELDALSSEEKALIDELVTALEEGSVYSFEHVLMSICPSISDDIINIAWVK